MSRKIEEVFDLPPMNEREEIEQPIQEEETGFDLDKLRETMETVDKIDAALPAVRDLEALDHEMDDYAKQAINAFQDLMDLGQNVEDRHAAPVFDSASKMMTNAITAKTAKMDKKLKMIEMQMRKRKLDLEEKKLEHQIAKENAKGETAIEGEAEEFFDRSSLLNDLVDRIKSNNPDK
jgi:hypothetical protein